MSIPKIQYFLDPNLRGLVYRDLESRRPWMTAMKVMDGLPVTDDQLPLVRAAIGPRNIPTAPAKEVYFLVGRRGGKSTTIADIAVHAAAFADTSVLDPGETGYVAVVANDRRQAGIIIEGCRERLRLSPILSPMVESNLAEEIRLTNRTAIRVFTCSTAAVRGYTLLCAILEEAAFWRVEGRDPGQEIMRSLGPGLLTTDGQMIIISSTYKKAGIAFEGYKNHFGRDGDVLVWVASSKTMNPTLSQKEIDRAVARDRVAAEVEYLINPDRPFRDDISGFLDDETLDPLVVSGRRELAPQEGIRYFAFADPSGGRQDSFTLGLAHAGKEGRVILDAVRRRVPPFNPGEVVAEFAQVLKEYRCSELTGDAYSAEWVVASFREQGITYRNSERDRSLIYKECLPLFTRGEAELLDDKVLLAELRGLERKTRPLGQDMITHGPGGHDDVCNSACGALVLAKGKYKREVRSLLRPLGRRPEPKPEPVLHPRLQFKTQEIPCGKED